MIKNVLGLVPLSLIALLSSCGLSNPVISEDDQAAIYTEVIRRLYTVDHTYGDHPPNFPFIFLPCHTDDRAGDPFAEEAKSRTLAEPIQETIVANLGDLPAKFVWVDDRDEVPMNMGSVAGDGAIITLGNIYLQEDGSVQVAASIFFANTGAGGYTYIVEKADGVWKIKEHRMVWGS